MLNACQLIKKESHYYFQYDRLLLDRSSTKDPQGNCSQDEVRQLSVY